MDPLGIFRRTAHGRGVADIRQVRVDDGPGAGGRLLEVRTPSGLAADIALDRGGDLLRLAFRGEEIGWRDGAAHRLRSAAFAEDGAVAGVPHRNIRARAGAADGPCRLGRFAPGG